MTYKEIAKRIALVILKNVLTKRAWHMYTTERIEIKSINYTSAYKFIKSGWTIAKEENCNSEFGIVFLERRAVKKEFIKLGVVYAKG